MRPCPGVYPASVKNGVIPYACQQRGVDFVTPAFAALGLIASPAKRFLSGSLSSGVCRLDFDVVAVDTVPVQGLDRLVRFGIARHLDETESFGSAGKPVFYYFDAFYITELGK
jgi:hypothetical protein